MSNAKKAESARQRAEGQRRKAGATRDQLAAQVERLGIAVRELTALVQRHHGAGAKSPGTPRPSSGVGEQGPRVRIDVPRPPVRRPDAAQPVLSDAVETRMRQMHARIEQLEAENASLRSAAAQAEETRRKLAEVQEQFEHLRDHGHFHAPGEK